MLNPHTLFNVLQDQQFDFFSGVPDSILKHFLSVLNKKLEKNKYIITANEGNALAICVGYYIATQKVPVLFLQNSGIGNIINPYLSLASPFVYDIPLLLIIGWRGAPDMKDEPQHFHQGRSTIDLMKSIGIDFQVLSKETSDVETIVKKVASQVQKSQKPFALLIKPETFDRCEHFYSLNQNPLSRSQCIELIIKKNHSPEAMFIASTGKISRDFYHVFSKMGLDKNKLFLNIGAMGHTNHIALGIAMQKKDKKIYCIEGDGSLLMHMGSLAIIGDLSPNNFIHIVLNNGSHSSVGNQPTVCENLSLKEIAKASGYSRCNVCSNYQELEEVLVTSRNNNQLTFIEVKINTNENYRLGRPDEEPVESLKKLIKYMQ